MAEPRPAIAWSSSRALLGVAYALPAAIVALRDPAMGIPLAIGVLPAAILPVPARRRDRVLIFGLGVVAGFSMLVGGIVSQLPTVAVALVLGILVLLAAAAARTLPGGRIVLTLGVPLVAVGLSYDDLATSAGAFLVLSAGALYAWLVALALPARDPGPRAAPRCHRPSGMASAWAPRRRSRTSSPGRSATTIRAGRRPPACSSRGRSSTCSSRVASPASSP
jgi:hypothetical protein